MKNNILILQCWCAILLSIVTIILILLVVYGDLKETNSQKKIMEIFPMLAQIIHHLLSANQTLLAPFQMEEEKIAVPLKYLSNFWRSLETPLINCKVELSLKWYENCILSSAGTAATFTITDTKLYVPVVTLKTEDNTKLSKLLSKGFKRPISWNEYKVTPNKNYDENEYIRERLDASIQEIRKLFVLAYSKENDNAT